MDARAEPIRAIPAFPHITVLPNHLYRLDKPWRFKWQALGANRELRIPAGFVFDAGSVPRIFWGFIDPVDLIAAALPHDFLYRKRGCPPAGSYFVDGVEVRQRWSRKDVDRLFGVVARAFRVKRWKRRVAYPFVRVFGWRFFGKPESRPLRRVLAEAGEGGAS